MVCSSLPSLQGAALLGSAQRKAPFTLLLLPPSCSQLALAFFLALGSDSVVEPHHCLVRPLSLAMPPSSWLFLGTDSWSFCRTHLMTGEEHFLTEELMSSLGLFKSPKRQIHNHTSVSYYLRHSCAKFRSSDSQPLSSAAPQFWNCLKFQMILPVKFPRYQTVHCKSHPELLNS